MAQRSFPIAKGVLVGDLDANGRKITNLDEPTEESDAATKEYVDTHGSVPSDYGAVRENAAKGAAHANETGNPHGTTADKIKMGAESEVSVSERISLNREEFVGHAENESLHVSEVQKESFADKYTKAETDALVDPKRDKTDNICAKDGFGEWKFSGTGFDSRKEYEVRITEDDVYRDYDLYVDGVYTATKEVYNTNPPLEHIEFDQTYFFEPLGIVADLEKTATKDESYVTKTYVKEEAGSQVSAAKDELNDRIDLIEATSHPNMGIVGEPVFREGVVSGFSATDYLMFPTEVAVGQNAVDFYMAFTTGPSATTQQNLLDSAYGLACAVRNGQLVTAVSTTGTSFAGEIVGGAISANSAYRLKISFRHDAETGYSTSVYLADGSGEYVQVGNTIYANAPLHPTATYWGGANPTTGVHHVFGGSINLAECRTDWNGKTVWSGYTEVPTYSKGVKDDGSPVDMELNSFFTDSNDVLVETIAANLPYSHNTTPTLKDRAFNALSFDGTEYNLSTALTAVTPTVEGAPRDLLIVATASAATTVSYTAGTIKGDKPTIDGEGKWIITLTEFEPNTWYCRQIKMEDAK